jgi:hypothetical protein
MNPMRNFYRTLLFMGALLFAAANLLAQSGTGGIDFSAQISPTGAHPEPIRQFTFYILTKSYADITKEVEVQDPIPTLDDFVDKWPCSPELKKWMKEHKTVDLSTPDVDKLISPDNIMKIPEFFDAYERSNSGGVTKGLPQPKYKKGEQQNNPDKFEKDKQDWLTATRHFIESNTYTIQGIELELGGVNPKPAWDKIHLDHRRKIAQLAPDTAQVKYLVTKTETDLDGRAAVSGLPAGTYWISSLGLDASSGDRRLTWDVPVQVAAGQTARLQLSNINGSNPQPLAAQ